MALTPYATKLLVDFLTGAAAAPRPSAWYVGVDVDVPRVSALFAPASNYAILASSLKLGPVTSECTVVAVGIWDAQSAGNQYWSGSLSACPAQGTTLANVE